MTTTYTYTDINFPGSANQGTSVVGINNSGEVSGSYIATDGFTHGFTEVNGTYTTVDYPSPSINTTYGQKLNNDGDVVGYFPYSGVTYSYINDIGDTGWTGFTLSVSSQTVALGVNDADVIVGYANFGQNHYSGFATISVSATPGASTYTKLDVPNSSQTFATDINDSGVIVGSYNSLIDHLNHGFVFDGTTWTTLDVPGYPNTTNPPKGSMTLAISSTLSSMVRTSLTGLSTATALIQSPMFQAPPIHGSMTSTTQVR